MRDRDASLCRKEFGTEENLLIFHFIQTDYYQTDIAIWLQLKNLSLPADFRSKMKRTFRTYSTFCVFFHPTENPVWNEEVSANVHINCMRVHFFSTIRYNSIIAKLECNVIYIIFYLHKSLKFRWYSMEIRN